MPPKKKASREKMLEDTLYEIAIMGHGMNDKVRDDAAIGRNAVELAKRALAGKCECCGRANVFEKREAKR